MRERLNKTNGQDFRNEIKIFRQILLQLQDMLLISPFHKLPQQGRLQRIVSRRNHGRLLGFGQAFLKVGRNVRANARGLLHHFPKFRRVRSGEYDTRDCWFPMRHQACIAHGSMGAHDVAGAVRHVLHDTLCSSVIKGGAFDRRTHGGEVVVKEGFEARTVRGVSHVHGVAQGGNRRPSHEIRTVQESIEAVVGIGGCDEAGVGHAHLGCENARRQIACCPTAR